MAKDWSDREIGAIVRDYFVMLEHEQMGRAYSKAEHRRVLMRVVRRSKGSIERKHMNISAVMKDLQLPHIRGYKPYRNYQRALYEAVKASLEERQDLFELLTSEAGAVHQSREATNNSHIDIDFRYWVDGRKLPLPSWGKFYMQLGASVAEQSDPQSNIVTALAVPTRSYAAAFVAAGAIICRARTIDTKGQISSAAHFEMLSRLPAGTSVVLRKGEKSVKGKIVGTNGGNGDGSAMIGIQTQAPTGKGGPLIVWIPAEASLRVQVSSKIWTQLPANSVKSADVSKASSEFVARIFQGADFSNFFTKSSLDCVILGSVASLKQEATATKLSVGSDGQEASAGTLRDILRIRRLMSTHEAFRSDIFPVNPKGNAMESEEMAPHLVIFDGAVGFLKWRYVWSHCNWVVILDRTEPRFTEAVQIVNEEYWSRISDEELRLSDAPPDSVELVSFTVAR